MRTAAFFKWGLPLAFLGLLLFAGWASWQFVSPGPLPEDKTLILPEGSGLKEISRILGKEEVIAHPYLFGAISYILRGDRVIKAGEYLFPSHARPRDVFELLIQGKTVLRRVTLPEGITVREMAEVLKNTEGLKGFFPSGVKECELFPDTYFFSYGDQILSVVERARQAMRNRLDDLWLHRKEGLPLKTPEEAVILASIVEKETGRNDERARVAAVFVNRLKKGMKLQADPTVIYGITEGQSDFGRTLTGTDLRTATEYNTYQIDGLPPGPIACPGEAALKATLNPADTNDLYFVANGLGGHHFAATLKQHNENVRLYRERMGKK